MTNQHRTSWGSHMSFRREQIHDGPETHGWWGGARIQNTITGVYGQMETVRMTEAHAEWIAHTLDDALHIPGSRIRFGLDPLIGIVPVVGDVIATACGAPILFIARRLRVPLPTLLTMALRLLTNGLIGSVPIFGDAFSFLYKCHAKNVATLLRSVKQGTEGSCALIPEPVGYREAAVMLLLIGPIVALVGLASLWFWQRDISYVSLLFPPPYQSRAD